MKLLRHSIVLLLGFLPTYLGATMVVIDFGPGSTPGHWNPLSGRQVLSGLHDTNGKITPITLSIESGGQPFGVHAQPDTIPGGPLDLTQMDGNLYQFGGLFKARLEGLVAGQTYQVYVFGLRAGAPLRQHIEIQGQERVKFTQTAGDGELAVNARVGSAVQELADYAVRVTADAQGYLHLAVQGDGPQGKPFVLAGLALQALEHEVLATDSPRADSSQPKKAVAATVNQPLSTSRDILGVHLDMPLTEASQLAKQYNPLERDVPIADGDTGGYLESSLRGYKFPFMVRMDHRDMRRGWKQLLVWGYGPPHAGKVAAVARKETFPEPVLWQQVEAGLIDKYGPPVFHSGLVQSPNQVGTYTLSWSSNTNHRPLKDLQKIRACLVDGQRLGSMVMSTRPKYLGTQSHCGEILIYHITAQARAPEFVQMYDAVLYDLPTVIARNTELLAFTRQEAAKIQAQQRKEAESRKPQF